MGCGFRVMGWGVVGAWGWEVGFGVLGFGFWSLGFGSWNMGFEFWVLGFGFLVLSVRICV